MHIQKDTTLGTVIHWLWKSGARKRLLESPLSVKMWILRNGSSFILMEILGTFQLYALMEIFTIILSRNPNKLVFCQGKERKKKMTRRITCKLPPKYVDFPQVRDLLWLWRFLTVNMVLFSDFFWLSHLSVHALKHCHLDSRTFAGHIAVK